MIKALFHEKCPVCHTALKTNQAGLLGNRVIKYCPHGHYDKEFHPALESFIETISD